MYSETIFKRLVHEWIHHLVYLTYNGFEKDRRKNQTPEIHFYKHWYLYLLLIVTIKYTTKCTKLVFSLHILTSTVTSHDTYF